MTVVRSPVLKRSFNIGCSNIVPVSSTSWGILYIHTILLWISTWLYRLHNPVNVCETKSELFRRRRCFNMWPCDEQTVGSTWVKLIFELCSCDSAALNRRRSTADYISSLSSSRCREYLWDLCWICESNESSLMTQEGEIWLVWETQSFIMNHILIQKHFSGENFGSNRKCGVRDCVGIACIFWYVTTNLLNLVFVVSRCNAKRYVDILIYNFLIIIWHNHY